MKVTAISPAFYNGSRVRVGDVVQLMERHFDASELGGVVEAIDQLFANRFDAMVNSLQLGRPPRGAGPSGGHGGPRKPRHLH